MIKITVDNTNELYQYDVNRSVIVSGLDPGVKYEFHFTTDNMNSVIVKETSTDTDGNVTAKIPNQLLTDPYPIILLIYGTSDDVTKTYCKTTLYPIARPKPDGYILPDDEDAVKTYEVLKKDIEILKTDVEDLKRNGGGSNVDLSGYVKTEELEAELSRKTDEVVIILNGMMADVITGGDLIRILNDYATKSYVDSAIGEALEADY